MTVDLIQGDILSKTCDLLVVGVFQGMKRLTGVAAMLDKEFDGDLASLIASKEFDGKLGEKLVFPTFGSVKARAVAVIGLGKKDAFEADVLRQFGGHIVKIAREEHAKSVATTLYGVEEGKIDARSAAHAFVEGVLLGSHRFHTYKGTQHKKKKEPRDIVSLTIVETEARHVRAATEGMELARVMSDATMLARDLVNTPSADMTPMALAEAAKQLATRGSHITCRVFDEKAMERMGMNAALAVARGSSHRPVAVHLVYKPTHAKKKLAIVGKAVTFDSGGLSIKPADSMMTMKIDMAGAASVIGLFKALASLQPSVEVHGIFLAVENMPSGSAYRPGDVVTAMDGTTIEVLNTDAEGRVTLADALSYAMKLKPDAIVDLATLTGACVVALGEEIAAILSNNESLTTKLLAAAKETGEPLWQLPLYAPYAKMIQSKIADIKNIGGGHGGGVITATHFLKTFIDDTPWAHLDIAGPSYIERETRPDQPYGASGYGVRLLAKYIQKI